MMPDALYDPFVGAIAGAVGGISQSIGAGKVAKSQERSAGTQSQASTLQAVLAYKAQAQQAQLAREKARRQQQTVWVGLIAAGLIVTAFLLLK